eukprot:tig00001177_g7369.t1
MSDVFKALGVQASWPLRRVCRRWRQVVEETEWSCVELRLKPAKPSVESVYACDAALALFEEGTLRCGGGASVSLRLELVSGSATKYSHRRALAAACAVLSGVVRGGPAQVTVELVRAYGHAMAEDDDDSSCSYFRDRSFLRDFLLDLLRALAPPGGAPSGLQSLSIGLNKWFSCWSASLAWPEPAELRAALAPFGGLESLVLFFDDLNDGAGPEEAAALAAACPLLRSLSFRPHRDSARGVLAALAPLARLRELALMWPNHWEYTEAVEALAGSATGRDLRSIAIDCVRGPFRAGQFPRRSADARPSGSSLTGAALAALSRMPSLETILALELGCGQLEPEDILALGRAAGLREATLHFDGHSELAEELTEPAMHALGDALDALPRLQRLALRVRCFGASPAAVAALLSGAGARRTLADLDLQVARPLTEAEAEAILALPALRRLRIAYDMDPPGFPLRPYEVLRGLRRGVRLKVVASRHGYECEPATSAAVQAMFAAGWPPWAE